MPASATSSSHGACWAFPEDRLCGLLITLGVPADRPFTPIQQPDRRPFTDVVHRGHW
jgi:hypothetical protein